MNRSKRAEMSEIAVMLLPDFHFLWVEKCQSFPGAAQSTEPACWPSLYFMATV